MKFDLSPDEAALLIHAVSAGRSLSGEFTENEQAVLRNLIKELNARMQEVCDELATDA